MKMHLSSKTALICVAAALTVVGSATPAQAEDLNARVGLHGLSPQEVKAPTLAGIQIASGLSTVGLGQPAYLEAMVNVDYPASDLVGVTWSVTGKPPNSAVAITNDPLGNTGEPYKQTDRNVFQLLGRARLVPDLEGVYTVEATITTRTNGITKVTQKITAAKYLGAITCALCHSGGVVAENTYVPWSQTPHASAFTNAIDGISTDHFSTRCISCHVVGYDANTNAVNDGWDDIAATNNWQFPAVATEGNFAAMPKALRNVSNIQCENCHGPGSQHAFSLGDTNLISVSLAPGACSQCHDSLDHHFKSAEWNSSRHAMAVEETSSSCARCHTAKGYANFVGGEPAVEVPYEGITCAACHDPHMAGQPHQLRAVPDVALMDEKTIVTEGGKVCMNCHISRRNATNYVEVTAGSNRYGPHHGPQTDMFVGANAMNYGQEIPSSAHREVIEDSCVTCHMQENEGTPSFTHAGGHTMSMKWDNGTNVFEMTEACVQCHGEIEGFDFKRQDYDGDGLVEGVQTEVKGLLDKLAIMLPPYGSTVVPTDTATIRTFTRPELRAFYNYLFVEEDGSFGVHNLSYAVGILKASIADLSGDANNDGVADWWQKTYFNDNINDPMAAPNANPSGDGMPNWLKLALGLDPRVAGTVVPDGVVFANGKAIGGTADTVHIYTAAEVKFDTEVGKKYQIQAVSTLGGGWVTLGEFDGTGAALSYLTPTHDGTQQYYRVVHTP